MWRYTVFVLALVAATFAASHQRGAKMAKSPGEQCRAKGFPGACRTENPAERCQKLECAGAGGGDIPMPDEVGPASEGTTCGHNKVCTQGKCIVNKKYIARVVDEFHYGCDHSYDYFLETNAGGQRN